MPHSPIFAAVTFGLVLSCVSAARAAADDVHVKDDAQSIRLSNGIITLDISKTSGQVTSIQRALDGKPFTVNGKGAGLYWDSNAEVDDPAVTAREPKKGYFRPEIQTGDVAVTLDTPQRGEVAVRIRPNAFFAFNGEYRFSLAQGASGFYGYVVLHHGATAPAATLTQTRFVLRTPEAWAPENGPFTTWVLDDKHVDQVPTGEVVKQVTDATFLLSDGTYKTKYMNSVYWDEAPVYGTASPKDNPRGVGLGVWVITASGEYHNGGPIKQGQTVHDNVVLRVLQSVHFGASPLHFEKGEEWSKIYGPFYYYLNTGDTLQTLWQDAKAQQVAQKSEWPYDWVNAPEYAKERGKVSGRVELGDHPAGNAWVILTAPGEEWTKQGKGYSFWTRLDDEGKFTLSKVRPGSYTLWVSGADQPTDFSKANVTVAANATTDLGTLDWAPVKHGETVWQIGVFDRSSGEFRNGDSARDYQMFRRYPQQFPEDVTYTIGKSDPRTDWNYAQWSFYVKKPAWTIKFDEANAPVGKATLTLGFASAQPAHARLTDLRVAVNGTEVDAIHLPKTGTAGYRGGVQDSQYNTKYVTFDASLLHAGTNEITLRHANARPFNTSVASPSATEEEAPAAGSPGQVMYDALRLEIDPRAVASH